MEFWWSFGGVLVELGGIQEFSAVWLKRETDGSFVITLTELQSCQRQEHATAVFSRFLIDARFIPLSSVYFWLVEQEFPGASMRCNRPT